jgi:hypothetical protein
MSYAFGYHHPFTVLSDGQDLDLVRGNYRTTFRDCRLTHFNIEPHMFEYSGGLRLTLEFEASGAEEGGECPFDENTTVGELLALVQKKLDERKKE